MLKKKFFVFGLFLFILIFFSDISIASTKLTGIENFPESYQPYLKELKAKHPNWEFTALYTGFDWNYVISQEYANDKNLVPKSYSDDWKCRENGKYDVEIDAGWVNASKKAVEYTMDPRNFLNEVRIFQFEKLSYDPAVNTKEGVEKILYGTEFYQRKVTYRTASGQIIDMNETYSDLIWNAAFYSGVSPYHLASRIKQEVGPFITHSSICGTISGYEGLYNFYNIGATSSPDAATVIRNGLQYAKDGKGASEETKNNQFIPWDTPERAIKGGAVFIGSSYISVGQNSLYLQKFDVNDDRGSNLFWHQYMTNCLAPFNESSSIYKAYSSNGMLDSSIGFIIPVYSNMPDIPKNRPDVLETDYVSDNTKVYANVTGNLNVRTGPSTSFDVLTQVTKDRIMTRIEKGIQNGERWDKVKLDNGMVGYVFQSYLEEVQEPTQPEIPEQPNPEQPDTPNTSPEEPEQPDVPDVPEDNVPPVQEEDTNINNGEIIIDKTLRVEESYITGLNLEQLQVENIKKLIQTQLKIVFVNINNEELGESDTIGTGTKVIFKNESEQVLYEYTFIIYGDVNGDGLINSLDVLVTQKHILETKLMSDVFKKAGNISRTGENPTSLDVLKMQRHILEIKKIQQ